MRGAPGDEDRRRAPAVTPGAFPVAWYRFRTSLPRRWSGYLAVAAVVALVGGAAMGAVAGARRTQSAFPAFLARTRPSDLSLAPYIPNADVIGLAGSPTLASDMTRLPHVRRVGTSVNLIVLTVDPGGHPNGSNAIAVGTVQVVGSPDGLYSSQDRVVARRGRLADPSRVDE